MSQYIVRLSKLLSGSGQNLNNCNHKEVEERKEECSVEGGGVKEKWNLQTLWKAKANEKGLER